jgi:hypothetical protein
MQEHLFDYRLAYERMFPYSSERTFGKQATSRAPKSVTPPH